jgi:hypothetical protein
VIAFRSSVHAFPSIVVLFRDFADAHLAFAALSLFVVSLSTRPALALEWPDDDTHVLPCRPTITCTADIAAPGAFEIEAGALYKHLESPGPEWSFPFLLKLSLARWLQVQVGSNGFTAGQDPGEARYLDNLNLVAKFHIEDADANGLAPSLAVSAALGVPTFSGQEGYTTSYNAFFVAYASKDLGPIHADTNVGVNVGNLDTKVSPQEFASLALSIALPPPFGLMAEGYYFSDDAPVALHDGGFLFALSHSPRPWLTFDVGGDIGFFPSTRSYSAFVGMTIIPVVLWK